MMMTDTWQNKHRRLWKLNQNTMIFIQVDAYKIVGRKMGTILFKLRCVKNHGDLTQIHPQHVA